MDQKQTILYTGFFKLPDLDAAANRVMNNAKAFRDLGNKVVLLDEQENYPFRNLQDSKRTIDGFTVYSRKRPNNKKEFLLKMLSAESEIEIINHEIGITLVIAYNYPSIALLNLFNYCKKRGIIVCSDCTEWYSGKGYGFPKSILSDCDTFFRMRIVNKKLDGIICISKYLENYYSKQTTVLIPPLVDISDALWNQEKIDYDKKKINLVYGGDSGRYKDQIIPLLETIEKNKNKNNYVFRIIGMSDQTFQRNWPTKKALVENLSGIVSFCNRVSHKDYIRILLSSDYLIFIRQKTRSNMAGFPTKFTEAVTVGIGVITTDTSDIKMYVENNCNCTIINNIDDLQKVLSDLEKPIEPEEPQSSIFDYNNYLLSFKSFLNEILRKKKRNFR